MVTVADNLDLATRRKRLGLTQQALADLLGLPDRTALSTWETRNQGLPRGLTRSDVVRALDAYERGKTASTG